jgi:peroxiredoxin
VTRSTSVREEGKKKSLTGGKAARRSPSGGAGGRRTTLLLAAITALAILAIGAFSYLIAGGSSGGEDNNNGFTPNNKDLLPVGSQAPDFNATTVDGSSVSLEDKGGKDATMLVFFATWCPHCNKEAPIISELADSHQDLRVIMVGIDGQDNPDKVQAFVEKYGIEGPAVYDPSLDSPYKVSGYPTVYVLDKDQKIVAANAGETSPDVLEGWVEDAQGK